MKYRNPVIPGFYPDPSICRVGEDYYLVNSSFEFFPGVPLWHSRDLVNWEQLGYVLTRESQAPLKGGRTSGGIFAPTIRYHNGRFYMITTNITGGGHFFVYTDDINGEWSEPVWVKQMGIDPSLFWDDDGRAYFQSTYYEPGGQCIGQSEINLETGELLGETKPIWSGTGGKCPEGPHMYKINGYYYLMIAEGGTEYGHMETIARSKSVWGPFESCPFNPIITQRNYTPTVQEYMNPESVVFQAVGHADLVDDVNGRWWLIFHGIRPSQSMLHHIGRETMLAPVEWDENGWPAVNGGKAIKPEMETVGEAESTGADGFAIQDSCAFNEDFTKEESLNVRWSYLRGKNESCYELSGEGLKLISCAEELDGYGQPAFAGVRQRQFKNTVKAEISFKPEDEKSAAGISVFHTNEHHYDLIITKRDGRRAAVLYRRACDMTTESKPVYLPDEGDLTLIINSDKLMYEFSVCAENGSPVTVGTGRSQLLSTELMTGTFTGCFFAMFNEGNKGESAVFKSFSVER